MIEHRAPVHTADAVAFLLERSANEHLREGLWIYFRIPFGKPDTTYQGQISAIEVVDAVWMRVTVVPFGNV